MKKEMELTFVQSEYYFEPSDLDIGDVFVFDLEENPDAPRKVFVKISDSSYREPGGYGVHEFPGDDCLLRVFRFEVNK